MYKLDCTQNVKGQTVRLAAGLLISYRFHKTDRVFCPEENVCMPLDRPCYRPVYTFTIHVVREFEMN